MGKLKAAWPTPGTSWVILWGDKTTLSAPNPTALLDRLAAIQWEPCPRHVMRARLVDRAQAWTGTVIDEETDDAQFLRDLEAAGMFVLFDPTEVVYNNPTTRRKA